jgi:3-dehydroquinate synthetase
MVDASVGGKTGVDLREAKNGVGAFWQPSAVVCDVETLQTESPRGYASALAEVIKTAIIGDPGLLDLVEQGASAVSARDPGLLTEIVRRSVRVKARVVSQDEREGGLRAVLNLGHTVGHALETLGGYTALTHGEAVSLGLVAALRMGVHRGVTPPELAARIEACLAQVGLPTALGAWDLGAAARLIGHDKKRAGSGIRFVFAKGLGDVGFERVPLEDVVHLVAALT